MIERFRVTYVLDPGGPTFGTERLPEHQVDLEVATADLDEQAIVHLIRDRVAGEYQGVAVEAYPINAEGERIER